MGNPKTPFWIPGRFYMQQECSIARPFWWQTQWKLSRMTEIRYLRPAKLVAPLSENLSDRLERVTFLRCHPAVSLEQFVGEAERQGPALL